MLCSFMTISATLRNSSETGGGGMLEYSLAYERELESTTLVQSCVPVEDKYIPM